MAQVERTKGEAYNDMAVPNKKPCPDHQKPSKAHLRLKWKEGEVNNKRGASII